MYNYSWAVRIYTERFGIVSNVLSSKISLDDGANHQAKANAL